MPKQKAKRFDQATQVFLPLFTVSGFTLTSFKHPEVGIILNLCAQVFWLYAGWKAWKHAGQIGIFITSVFILIALLIGVVNYWLI